MCQLNLAHYVSEIVWHFQSYLFGFVALHTANMFCLTNGSNIWISGQPDQVGKTETMARGTGVLFVATSDCLPSHPTKDVCV